MTDSNPTFCVDCGVMTYLEEGKGWRCINCSSKRLSKPLRDTESKEDKKDSE